MERLLQHLPWAAFALHGVMRGAGPSMNITAQSKAEPRTATIFWPIMRMTSHGLETTRGCL